MKCEQIAELLPDYLQEALRPEQSKIVEQHLANCVDCTEVVALWKKLATLPDEQPSAVSRERFEAMLHAWQSGRADNLETAKRPSLWSTFQWLRSPVGAVAWSIALLVIGAYVGLQLGSTKSNSQDLAALHSELAGMRQLVALSMLQQQSASQRLEGVSWTRREDRLDPQVLSALKHTLRRPHPPLRAAAGAQQRGGRLARAAISARASGADRSIGGVARPASRAAPRKTSPIPQSQSHRAPARRLGHQQAELRSQPCAKHSFSL